MILLKSVTFKIFFFLLSLSETKYQYYHATYKWRKRCTNVSIVCGLHLLKFLQYSNTFNVRKNCTLNTSETCRKSGFQ